MSLPPFDLASADLGPGVVLLEASAGTGKTYAVVGILLRMLLEGRLERLDQALVVTFTIAATDELKNRLRAGLQRALAATEAPDDDAFFAALGRRPGAAATLRAALAAFDQVGIATIHGFCKRVLEEAAFESREPFRLDFAADPVVLLEQAAADALRALYQPGATLRNQLLHEQSVTPESLVQWYRLWQRHPDVALEPATPDFDARERAIAAALPHATAAYDDRAAALLLQMKWYADRNPWDEDREEALARFTAALRQDPASQVRLLAELGTSRLRATLQQNSRRLVDHPFFTACDPIAVAWQDAWPHLRAHLLLRMHDRVVGQKRAEHVLSFDDLLRRTHAALHDPQRGDTLRRTLQARHRVALIDEFQDTDRLQYEIFATCFATTTLFLIGDPKQAIYGFRGADLRTYLAARDDAQRAYTLAVNYRSSDPMVRAVNQLFERPFAFAARTIDMPEVRAKAAAGALAVADPHQGAALCWRLVAGDAADAAAMVPRDAALLRIARDVAAEIGRLLASARLPDDKGGERPVQPRDIAVLTRRNVEAVLIQDTLRQANITSAIGKAGDIFATDEVDELDRFLQAVLQPANLAAVRGALASRFGGLDAAQLQALDADERAFEPHLERLDRWRRLWVRSGFVPMVEQAMVDLAVVKRLLALQGGERRLTNFRQLFEMLHDAEHSGRRSPEGLLEWLRRERANQDELDYTVRELRLESDGDAVQILTMHGSKGLEYEITFCPFLWGGNQPRRTEVVEAGARGHGLAFEVRKDTPEYHRAMAAQLGEDLRLTYVALTRSRRRCYVHFGNLGSKTNGAWRSGLAWLLAPGSPDLPADADWPLAWASQWAAGSKDAAAGWRRTLEQKVEASGGTMSLAEVPADPLVQRLPLAQPAGLRHAERPGRTVRARGLHSFTSLVAGGVASEAPRDVADPPAALPPPAPARGIHAFARGAAAGQCLHEILEHADLGRLAAEPTRALVRSTLAAHGLVEAGAHPGDLDPVAAVVQMLHDVAAARIADGPTLGALCGGARLAEWEFLLPAEQAAVPALAEHFARSGSAAATAQASRLRALTTSALRGFLVGFVDLVAEHDGRYWVIDWKSNHLGPDAAAYHPDALQQAMLEHDYVLQYHLYLLALHRHLRQRLADYDPARHLGGACYVFLRGVQPGSENGLFVDRVPPALVAAMDRWIAGDGRRGPA